MLERTHAATAESVTALVRPFFAKRGVSRLVGRDESLTESGLTSLDIVNLMLAIEAEFDVKIPDADMTPANFRTMARIAALIEKLKGQ